MYNGHYNWLASIGGVEKTGTPIRRRDIVGRRSDRFRVHGRIRAVEHGAAGCLRPVWWHSWCVLQRIRTGSAKPAVYERVVSSAGSRPSVSQTAPLSRHLFDRVRVRFVVHARCESSATLEAEDRLPAHAERGGQPAKPALVADDVPRAKRI